MKRLAFCFDGTWNRLDAPAPTNVVITAQSISPIAKDGVVQIIHYDQGVGTAKGTELAGGLFGEGLLDNIINAYTFLVFNYEVGDEIYLFGFSRGAYTARSFVGLLRTVGILRRRDAGEITAAIQQYKNRKQGEDHNTDSLLRYRLKASPQVCIDQFEDAWRCKNSPDYVSGSSPVFRVRYLGVWDTVGAMGVPNSLLVAPLLNKNELFYDTDLSDLVVKARHAVAIDEQRESFAPTLWTNFEALNASLGYGPADEKAPYQQKWFPGVHGSVGGGGTERGLSDFALGWIVDGARDAGLELDATDGSPIFSLDPRPLAPLVNVKNPGTSFLDEVMKLLPKAARMPGPDDVHQVSPRAIKRWAAAAKDLPEGALYRPATLGRVAAALDKVAEDSEIALPPVQQSVATTAVPTPGTYYRIVRRDTLSAIAQRAYHATSKDKEILLANRKLLVDADHIYEGEIIYLPLLAEK
jgi:uncharacterized protein (DUF2235 family)